jgi:hypothetical protein
MIAIRRAAVIGARGAGALAVLGVGYLARNWYRYGKVSTRGSADPLLDRFMPTYEVREYHEARVAAPAEITFEAARSMDITGSRLVRGLFRARELVMRAARDAGRQPRPLLEEVQALGWGVLAEERDREIVLGAVTQPWLPNVRFESLAPEEFASFAKAGYVKIAWTLAVEPIEPGSSIVRTETRATTTDQYARDRFRRYWALVSPGVRLIRVESLRLVRAEAERRFRAARAEPTAEVTV